METTDLPDADLLAQHHDIVAVLPSEADDGDGHWDVFDNHLGHYWATFDGADIDRAIELGIEIYHADTGEKWA